MSMTLRNLGVLKASVNFGTGRPLAVSYCSWTSFWIIWSSAASDQGIIIINKNCIPQTCHKLPVLLLFYLFWQSSWGSWCTCLPRPSQPTNGQTHEQSWKHLNTTITRDQSDSVLNIHLQWCDENDCTLCKKNSMKYFPVLQCPIDCY